MDPPLLELPGPAAEIPPPLARPEEENEDEDAEDREKHERALENAVLDKKSVIRKISGPKVQIVIGSSQPEGNVSYGKSVTIKRPKK
jgi:hypothetical protein